MRFRSAAAAACLAAAQALVGAAAVDAPNTIQVRQAWIRWLPGSAPAGAYLTLINGTDQPISLLAAASIDYGSVGLHRSLMHAGVSTMAPVDRITVAAHSTLEFASQGYHLMLKAPTIALNPGDHVSITLTFDGGSQITVPFEIRRPDGSAARPALPTESNAGGQALR
jgi:periplasmic copper chaperone A